MGCSNTGATQPEDSAEAVRAPITEELDRTESLHWRSLGDVQHTDASRRAICGRTLVGDVDIFPYRGSTDVDHAETED